jgi:hypothetical protein
MSKSLSYLDWELSLEPKKPKKNQEKENDNPSRRKIKRTKTRTIQTQLINKRNDFQAEEEGNSLGISKSEYRSFITEWKNKNLPDNFS